MRICTHGFVLVCVGLLCSSTLAQSSSLFTAGPPIKRNPVTGPGGQYDRLSPSLAKASYSAVPLPEPRKFSRHGLVTIIIRETIENDTSATMETNKTVTYKGKVSDFPHLRLSNLLNLQTRASATDNLPALGVKMKSDFESEGKRKRKDTFTTRLTARIIDIKPNGTLVLEARKRIIDDTETLNLVLTGTCRKEDIKSDNTVLSTQLYDLNLRKHTDGQMQKSTKKGILTRVLDTIFNF